MRPITHMYGGGGDWRGDGCGATEYGSSTGWGDTLALGDIEEYKNGGGCSGEKVGLDLITDPLLIEALKAA